MKTEIVEAVDFGTAVVGKYEVGDFLTWEERKRQVKENRNEKVYCPFQNRHPETGTKGMVTAWFSISRSSWEKCRKIIRQVI